jgi:hypothetical protein
MGNSAIGQEWKKVLADRLPLYGHRNWIAVVDAAYPAQISPGIETILCGSSQLDVVKAVTDALRKAKHVRPTVYLDKELEEVAETDAPGIGDYRKKLGALLESWKKNSLLHEEIIEKLDEAGNKFKILLFKTNLTLPYTSVFFQLDCGYWDEDAEARLRERMSE